MKEYMSYRALDRKPLLGGVPVITGVLSSMITIFSTGIALYFFKDERAFIPLVIGFVWLMFVRSICLNDSRAQEKFYWKLRGILTRIQCARTSTSVYTAKKGRKSERRDEIARFIKNAAN